MINLITKMSSKKLFAKIVSGFVGLNLLVPMIALAQAPGEKKDRPLPREDKFCQRLEAQKSKIDQGFYSKETKLEGKREEQKARWEDKWQERDERLAEKRKGAEENRDAHFAKLEERAKTDEQKEAIAEFQKAVKDAVLARQEAVNKAINDYREGVRKAIEGRKAALDGAIEAFKESVKSAFDKAIADCGSGADPKEVKSALQASLKSAREKLHADRTAVQKVGDSIKPLIEARKAAFDKAKEDFRLAIEKAKEDLKAVLGENKKEEDNSSSE